MRNPTILLGSALLLASAFALEEKQDLFCQKTKKGKGQVTCQDITIPEGGIFTIDQQLEPSKKISSLTLVNVTGNIDENTLSYFPELQSVTIKNSDIENFVPQNSMKSLKVYNSFFQANLSNEACCKKLKKLGFYGNQDLELNNALIFKNLAKLDALEIVQQNISNLSGDFLAGLPSLKSLKLVDTNMETIDENAFKTLINLEELHIDDDSVKKLEINTFKPLKKLQELSIIGRNLEPLTVDMLDQQRKLKKLQLPTNTWKAIDVNDLKSKLPKLTNFGYKKDWAIEENEEMVALFHKIKQTLKQKKDHKHHKGHKDHK